MNAVKGQGTVKVLRVCVCVWCVVCADVLVTHSAAGTDGPLAHHGRRVGWGQIVHGVLGLGALDAALQIVEQVVWM